MIKLIISDFDGVICDTKDIHFEAFNKAVESVDPKFSLSREEHLKSFDGLSTRKKLKIFVDKKGFPEDKIPEVNNLKQEITLKLYENISRNERIIDAVKKFKEQGYLFYVASNSIKETLEIGLDKVGILNLVDKIYSNDVVNNTKPHPEMYLKCMADAGVDPKETVILEDSKHGREAAARSGAHVYDMDCSANFIYEDINSYLTSIRPKQLKYPSRNTLNVLIPMAGEGQRFRNVGFELPKPLIPVNGKPMIQLVVENLNVDAHYIFVCQDTHYDKYNLESVLNLIAPGCTIVKQHGKLQGATCSTLLAKEFINNDKHLLIANSDQQVEWSSGEFLYSMLNSNCDGGILTFKANHEKWSYARTDEDNNVLEVAEKKVISDNATCGIYFYNKGSEFVKYAEQMISKGIMHNNEFYNCPIFNEYIADNKKVKISQCKAMHGIGTPEDLAKYLEIFKD